MSPGRLAFAFTAFVMAAGLLLAAKPELIPAAEMLANPTPVRLKALADRGTRGHWDEIAAAARTASFSAYRQNQLQAAEAWQYVQKWSELFDETEAQFIPPWIKAVESMGVAHGNMPQKYLLKEDKMGAALDPELRLWLLGDVGFSAEFFSLLTTVDFVPRVFQQLNEIHAADPAQFREYASLALAIAVVFDVPPPPDWPHGQVSARALPRRLPPALTAFDWWVREDEAGHTYHRLAHLGADELKFVVDAAAPFEELAWSQKNVPYALSDFAETYSMVSYRTDRVETRTMNWPGSTYPLWDILHDGGLCVDQA
jgi:hypothetical protein